MDALGHRHQCVEILARKRPAVDATDSTTFCPSDRGPNCHTQAAQPGAIGHSTRVRQYALQLVEAMTDRDCASGDRREALARCIDALCRVLPIVVSQERVQLRVSP